MHLRAKNLNLDIFDHPHATFFQKSIPQLKFPHMSYYHRFTKVVASLYEFKLSGYTLHSCKEL